MRFLFTTIICLAAFACGSVGYARRDATTTGQTNRRGVSGWTEGAEDGPADGRPVSAGEVQLRKISAETGMDAGGRVVIYTGRLGISVSSLDQSIPKAEEIAKRYGGFTASNQRQGYWRAQLILRVRAEHFRAAMKELESMGVVDAKQIDADDKTGEYQSTERRIKLARTTRERLYTILARTTDAKERVKILKEIDRLTRQIDTAEARNNHLKTQASLATIMVMLRVDAAEGRMRVRSPFAWIERLTPAQRTIFTDSGFKVLTPPGFFDHSAQFRPSLFGLFSGPGDALFASPSGMTIRAGSVRNHPQADRAFWSKAVETSMDRRGWKRTCGDEEDSWKRICADLRATSSRRYYQVFIRVDQEWIHVVEILYANESLMKQKEEELKKWVAGIS